MGPIQLTICMAMTLDLFYESTLVYGYDEMLVNFPQMLTTLNCTLKLVQSAIQFYTKSAKQKDNNYTITTLTLSLNNFL